MLYVHNLYTATPLARWYINLQNSNTLIIHKMLYRTNPMVNVHINI